MKLFPLICLTVASLLSFSCSDVNAEPTEDPKNNELTDEEKFNALILKSDFDGFEESVSLKAARREDYSYWLDFSNGKSLLMGRHYCALVSSDENDYITINGKKSEHKVVDVPFYRIAPDGEWLCEGRPTGDYATPAAPSKAPEGGAYLRYIRQDYKSFTAYFSDGTDKTFGQRPEKQMFVKKTANQMTVYIGEKDGKDYIAYPFKKRYKAYTAGQYPSYLDNWGVMALKLCSKEGDNINELTEIFLNGEAEMAVQVTDGADPSKATYVGGTLHGFENICVENGKRALTINVDGQDIAEDGTFDLRSASKIEMTQESLICQAYTNSNPFGKAYRVWTFENGTLTIKITLEMLRDMSFSQGMFGMMCVLRRYQGQSGQPYLTCYAVRDNAPDRAFDVSDGWSGGISSKEIGTSKITEYGQMGWSFALAVDGGTRSTTGGGMYVGTNGNAYNKIYFDLTGKQDFKAGQTIWGQVHWEIEKTR